MNQGLTWSSHESYLVETNDKFFRCIQVTSEWCTPIIPQKTSRLPFRKQTWLTGNPGFFFWESRIFNWESPIFFQTAMLVSSRSRLLRTYKPCSRGGLWGRRTQGRCGLAGTFW